MRAIEVRDFSKFPRNFFDVLIKFMFSSGAPEEFIPGKEYSAGDLVFIVDKKGNVIIMQANGNGAFEKPTPPNWREYDLEKALEDMRKTMEKYIGLKARIGDQVYKPHTFQYPNFKKATDRLNNLGLEDYLNLYSYAEVYIDGKYIPRKYWELTTDDLSFTPEYLDNMPATCALTIRVNEAVSIVARMIKRVEVVKVVDSKKGCIIPYPPQVNDYDLRMEFYVNGEYIPSDKYKLTGTTDDDGNDAIQISEWEGATSTSYELTFSFIYSCTNEVAVMHDDFETVIKDERESFMLDLTTVDFVNSMQEIRVFRNNAFLDPARYCLSRGYVNFRRESYYLPLNSVICAPITTYLIPEYEDGEVRHNSQTTPIFENGEHEFTVPFLDYTPSTHDVILFNDSGVLISDVKWYFDEYEVKFFEHDLNMSRGDRIDFRMINRDDTVKVRNFWFTANEDNQRIFTGKTDFSEYQLIMIFTTTGMYIPTPKYTIDKNTITFDDSIELLQFEQIQIITFKYIYKETRTSFDIKRYTAEETGQTVFPNPYKDYDPTTDGLYIFTQNGKYVGERFYEIEDGNIKLLDGSDALTFGGYVEIVLIRDLTVTIQTGVK